MSGSAWRWRATGRAGQVIAEGGESFPTAEAALEASYRLRLFLVAKPGAARKAIGGKDERQALKAA